MKPYIDLFLYALILYSVPSGNMIVCGQKAFSSSSSILVFTDLAESTDPVFEREDLIR